MPRRWQPGQASSPACFCWLHLSHKGLSAADVLLMPCESSHAAVRRLLLARATILPTHLLALEASDAAHVPAACQCATAGYNPVCADGITWASPCDALCTGRPCYSSGVCQYNAAKATFTPTTGATSAAGGRSYQPNRGGTVSGCCLTPFAADANLACFCLGHLPSPCLLPIAHDAFA